MSAQVLCGLLSSIASSDTNRDIFFAQQIASGRYFPLVGPEINHTIHLGPLWYYLLAPALWLVPNAAAVTALMGAFSALQFPLAYHLARRFSTRQDAILFVLTLALPGWMTVAFASMTHTILVVPGVLLSALAALRYRDNPSAKEASLLGLSFALLASAHPTTALIAAALLLWALAKAPSIARCATHGAIAVAIPLLSLLPMLYALWQEGFDTDSIAAYSKGGLSLPGITDAVVQIYATLAFGPKYVLRFLMDRSPSVEHWCFSLYSAVICTASLGLILRLMRRGGDRALLVVLLCTLFMQAYFICLIRQIMPPWMVYSEWPLIAALIAAGLSRVASCGAIALWVIVVGTGATVGENLWAYTYLVQGIPDHAEIKPSEGKSGAFDIRDYEEAKFTYRLPRLRFDNLFEIGEPLCSPVTLYGQYAYLVDYTFAVSAAARCGSVDAVEFGGPLRDGRQALVGLTERTWAQLGLTPDRWVGPVGVARPRLVWSSSVPLQPVMPRLDNFSRKLRLRVEEFVVEHDAEGSEVVLVGHRAHRYAQFAVIGATANGQPIAPAYEDLVTSIFLPPSSANETVHWRLDVKGTSDYVDILTFAEHRSEPERR